MTASPWATWCGAVLPGATSWPPPTACRRTALSANATTQRSAVPQATKSSASAQTRQNQRCTVQRSSSQPQRRKTKCGSRRPNCASTKTQNTCPGGSCRRGSATGVRRHSSSGLGTPSRKLRRERRRRIFARCAGAAVGSPPHALPGRLLRVGSTLRLRRAIASTRRRGRCGLHGRRGRRAMYRIGVRADGTREHRSVFSLQRCFFFHSARLRRPDRRNVVAGTASGRCCPERAAHVE